MIRLTIYTTLVLLGFYSAHTFAWDTTKLASPVSVNGHIIPYKQFSIFVMPNAEISAGFIDAVGGVEITLDGEPVQQNGTLSAPATPGLSVLALTNTITGETSQINVFTLVPASSVNADNVLNGYRIGAYPKTPLRGLDIYLPPKGFVEVTEANSDVLVSPNFRLKEFVAKQASGYPKYIVLRSALLLKLENILATLNREGFDTPGLVIMSAYRTPFYNRAIGNVPYSRHVYGGAADFYIDHKPKDGRMDDLNQDGKVDKEDARWLATFINQMSQKGMFGQRIGGLGVYGSNAAHGPFVHIDVRGSRARW